MVQKTGKDLLSATMKADYKTIRECLTDGVPADYCEGRDGIYNLLFYAGWDKKSSDTNAMDCIKLLYENGAPLNRLYCDGGEIVHSALDGLSDSIKPKNPKDLYNAVKFVLTHGSKCVALRDDVVNRLENYGVMSEKEFDHFEEIGSAYLYAKELGLEFDFKNPEKSMREVNIERGKAYRKSSRSYEYDKNLVGEFLSNWNPYRISTLNQIRMLRKRVNEVLDKNEKKIMELLLHDKDRDEKAEELKEVMRERDAKGSKKTLRAFLKEKTAKVPAKKSKEME